MRPLRIAMLAPFGIRPKGTLSARMLPLARELILRGHSVEIVAPAYLNPQDAATTTLIDGVRVTHLRLPRLPEPAATLETSLLLLRAALQSRPDLLHLFKPKGGAAGAAAPAAFAACGGHRRLGRLGRLERSGVLLPASEACFRLAGTIAARSCKRRDGRLADA
jgi:hypothetical protein